MTSLPSILALGFVLGLRHATDADHVVAVTAIVSRDRRLRASSVVGALWGVGHMLTVLVVGGCLILFDIIVPLRVTRALELGVGVMLIALGAATLSGRSGRAGYATRTSRPRVGARPVLVGVVHGLAGSAAIAILVLSTIHQAGWALVYLVVFSVGTVAGMIALTTLIGLPFAYAAGRFDQWAGWVAKATGLASIIVGVVLAYESSFTHVSLSSP